MRVFKLRHASRDKISLRKFIILTLTEHARVEEGEDLVVFLESSTFDRNPEHRCVAMRDLFHRNGTSSRQMNTNGL